MEGAGESLLEEGPRGAPGGLLAAISCPTSQTALPFSQVSVLCWALSAWQALSRLRFAQGQESVPKDLCDPGLIAASLDSAAHM